MPQWQVPCPASTGSLSSESDRCQLEVKSGGYRTAGSCAEFVATVPERTPTSDCTGQYMTALEPLDWDRLVLASASALFPASDIAFERRGRRQTIDPLRLRIHSERRAGARCEPYGAGRSL